MSEVVCGGKRSRAMANPAVWLPQLANGHPEMRASAGVVVCEALCQRLLLLVHTAVIIFRERVLVVVP